MSSWVTNAANDRYLDCGNAYLGAIRANGGEATKAPTGALTGPTAPDRAAPFDGRTAPSVALGAPAASGTFSAAIAEERQEQQARCPVLPPIKKSILDNHGKLFHNDGPLVSRTMAPHLVNNDEDASKKQRDAGAMPVYQEMKMPARTVQATNLRASLQPDGAPVHQGDVIVGEVQQHMVHHQGGGINVRKVEERNSNHPVCRDTNSQEARLLGHQSTVEPQDAEKYNEHTQGQEGRQDIDDPEETDSDDGQEKGEEQSVGEDDGQDNLEDSADQDNTYTSQDEKDQADTETAQEGVGEGPESEPHIVALALLTSDEHLDHPNEKYRISSDGNTMHVGLNYAESKTPGSLTEEWARENYGSQAHWDPAQRDPKDKSIVVPDKKMNQATDKNVLKFLKTVKRLLGELRKDAQHYYNQRTLANYNKFAVENGLDTCQTWPGVRRHYKALRHRVGQGDPIWANFRMAVYEEPKRVDSMVEWVFLAILSWLSRCNLPFKMAFGEEMVNPRRTRHFFVKIVNNFATNGFTSNIKRTEKKCFGMSMYVGTHASEEMKRGEVENWSTIEVDAKHMSGTFRGGKCTMAVKIEADRKDVSQPNYNDLCNKLAVAISAFRDNGFGERVINEAFQNEKQSK